MKLKKLLLILMSVVMVLTTATVALVNVFADGNEAIVFAKGETIDDGTEYATLAEAIAAASALGADSTVVLLKDATTTAVVEAANPINIDGDGHTWTGSSYLIDFKLGGSVKDIKINSTFGFRFRNDASARTLTFDNVTANITNGLFVNMQGEKAGQMTLNIRNNSYISKWADSPKDPLIATYGTAKSHTNVINIDNSTMLKGGGTAKDGVGNNAMFYFNTDNAAEVNLTGTTNLYYDLRTSDDTGRVNIMFCGNAGSTQKTVNIGANVTLKLGMPAGKTEQAQANANNGFFFSKWNYNGAATTFTLNIAIGAKFEVSQQIANQGFYLPIGVFNATVEGKNFPVVNLATNKVMKGTSTLSYTYADDVAENAAAIGSTEYATLGEAIDAATEGQTVTLLRNVAEKLADKSPANNVTIDGDGKAFLNLAANKYIFTVSNKNLTIKNITIFSGRLAKSIMTDDTTNDATVGTHHLTLNNVTATINKDAMVNLSGDYYGEHVLNIVNCNLTQLTNNQPMIVTYPNNHTDIADERDVIVNITGSTLTAKNNVPVIWAHAYGEFDGNAELTVNVGTSTISQLGGQVANLAMSSIIRADELGCAVMNVNLNAGAKLVLNPIASNEGSAHRAMISSQAAETNVTLDDAATVEFGSKTEKNFGYMTHMYLIYNEGDFAQYWNDYTDNGAEWIVNEYAPKVIMPNVAGYVAITSNEGAIARPSAIGTAGTYTKANLVELGLTNGTGASIKLPADNSEKASIRFVAEVDAEFKALLGSSATYTSRVTKTSYLETANGDFKALEAEYYVDAPAVKWLDDTTFGVALTNIPDYNTDYAVTSYVTITYTDGTTATFWADFDDAANARSVVEVAQKALASGLFTQYTDGLNAVIEAASGNS